MLWQVMRCSMVSAYEHCPRRTQAMYVAKFWEEGDVGLMRAWVADLQAVGYTFPSVRVKPQPPALQPVNWQMPTPEHW